MEIVRCENGHFYDSEQNKTCPFCARGGVPGYGGGEQMPTPDFVGVTMPATEGAPSWQGSGDVGKTMPAAGFASTAPLENGMNGSKVQDYRPTEPAMIGGKRGFNPMVGWLVCTQGPDQGTDYRIRNQQNAIGRAQNMDICIRNDMQVSNERAATIAYDNRKRAFYLGSGTSHTSVYLNGNLVLGTEKLKAYDEIELGATTLLFIPLCGERFSWEDGTENK